MIFSVAISQEKSYMSHGDLVHWQVSRRMPVELAARGPQVSYCCASVELGETGRLLFGET